MSQSKLHPKKLLIGLLLGLGLMTHISVQAQLDTNLDKTQATAVLAPYLHDQLASTQAIKVMTYQMPYRSGDMQDASALVYYPNTPQPDDGWRIVVWTHGTVGVADACAPSNNPIGENFKKVSERLLKAGYVIIAPDYEGLGKPGIHPYLHLQSEADAAIYAVNAIKTQFPNEFQGEWMVAGQSQGGQAALGTAEYANLDPTFKGAVAGAPASGLQHIIRDVAPDALMQLNQREEDAKIPLEARNAIISYATLLAYGTFVGIGITASDPTFNYLALFHERAHPFVKLSAGSNGEDGSCLYAVRDGFKADIIDFLQHSEDATLLDYPGINTEVFHHHPALLNLFKISEPGTKRLDKPILVIQGEKDTNVPAVVTEKMVEHLMALGSPDVSFILVKDASHTEAIVWEREAVFNFIQEYMPAK